MAFFQLKKDQKIPAGLSEVWDFISSPVNLKEITPSYLGFLVTGKTGGEKMYPGMIITYVVKPVFGIPMQWMTEITHVKESEYFIDEQRIGPYRFWHHQHMLKEINGGVLMTDIVTYEPPLRIIGAVANKLFIKSQLRDIFLFRKSAIEQRYGMWLDGSAECPGKVV
jgi:ligand-binding SRPBCC domain-containing protein